MKESAKLLHVEAKRAAGTGTAERVGLTLTELATLARSKVPHERRLVSRFPVAIAVHGAEAK